MSNNQISSGMYVGIFEGIHKAFKIVDRSFDFNARGIILTTRNNDISDCTVHYFIDEGAINTLDIPVYAAIPSWIYQQICNTLNPVNPPIFEEDITVDEFIALIEGVVYASTNQRAYFIEILQRTGQNIYLILIFNTHQDLPNINTRIMSNQFNTFRQIEGWDSLSLIHALFLISILEIRDKWTQFVRSASGNTPMSVFTHLSEKEFLTRAALLVINYLVTRNTFSDSRDLNYFYSNVDSISRTAYEKREPRGILLLSNRQNLQSNLSTLSIQFRKRVALDKTRASRKVIEMSGNNRFILTDGVYLYGLGNTKAHLSGDFIEIHFQGFDQWQVVYQGNSLFKVKNGVPHIPRPLLTKEELQQKMQRIFNNELTSTSINSLYRIVNQAVENASHGALIVVCNSAIREAERLGNQAIVLESPTNIAPEILQGIFSIDGAILLGVDCMCYAIGVILDGQANNPSNNTPNGYQAIPESPARGSRYNSSVRYVNTIRSNCLTETPLVVAAIIISEDNQVNIV